jgi:nucleoside-diphosphate-sugar epimerase
MSPIANSPRKALVTGGAGFIGSNLVRLLVEQGVSVRVLDNLSTGYIKNIENLPIEFVQGDMCDASSVQNAVDGMDVVFHLAAHIGNVKSLEHPREDAQINVLGALNLLEAARKAGVRRIVYSSSAAIFGELLTMPIAEDHPQNPDSPYGVSKLAAEKYMLTFAKLYNMTVICLRYFNVYGVHQRYDAYGNVIPIFANQLVMSKPITIYGTGEQTRDFVNVKDVAKANFLAATQAQQTDVYNLGSGSNVTIKTLADYCQKASGINAVDVVYAPPRRGEVLHCLADISKAKSDLGFEPNPDILSGLQEYFDWFKKDRNI